ncbi:hypothetical protein [Megamonas hypermegale]|uniref:hypothetical protein n=1 Tax=Megamonas hypermegale TaxID=158847 RepID=UPI00195605EA|nr:hypothetical protein [Megamonas hypermegale]MBM6761665.1 hypothetical protein [Megamonas hypermegale]
MDIKEFDWKDVSQDITDAFFEQLKDNVSEYLEEAIIPELEKQKEAFVQELKQEAAD